MNTNEKLAKAMIEYIEEKVKMIKEDNSLADSAFEHLISTAKAIGDVELKDELHTIHESLASSSLLLFENTQRTKKEYIDFSISSWENAIAHAPQDIQFLSSYAQTLMTRYQVYGSTQDFNDAIRHFGKALCIETLESGDVHLSALNHLTTALGVNSEDVDQIIDMLQSSPELPKIEEFGVPLVLGNLGCALVAKYDKSKDRKDLDRAIGMLQSSIDLRETQDRKMLPVFSNLGSALVRKFDNTQCIEDLNLAIRMFKKATELVPPSDSVMPKLLEYIGIALVRKFLKNETMENLEQAIDYTKQFVEINPGDDDAKLFIFLDHAAKTLRGKYEKTGDINILEKEIWFIQQLISLTSESDLVMGPERLRWLAVALDSKFQNTGDIKYLEDAIIYSRKSVELAATSNCDSDLRFECLTSLGILLTNRFDHTDNVEDLGSAIKYQYQALEAIDEDEDGMASVLGNLGTSLLSRFKSQGNMEDLEQAIYMMEKSVELASESGQATLLSNLANALSKKFEHSGNMGDLERAVELFRKSIQLTSEGDPSLAGKLNDLGVCLWKQYQKSGNSKMLEESIRLSYRSIEITKESLDMPGTLDNLIKILWTKYDDTQDNEIFNQVYKVIWDYILLVLDHYPDVPKRLIRIGDLLISFAQHEKQKHTLLRADALYFYQQALEYLPEGHPLNSTCHIACGEIFNMLAFEDKNDKLSNISLFHYRKVVNDTIYSSYDRFQAISSWIHHQYHSPCHDDVDEIMNVCSAGYELLPQIISIGQTISNRFRLFEEQQKFFENSVSLAIRYGKYETAVEWCEQFSGYLWIQIHILKSPSEQIRDVDPDLAAKFNDLSSRLESYAFKKSSYLSVKKPSHFIDIEKEAQENQTFANEWDSLLQQARKYPTLEKFLMPIAYKDMIEQIPSHGKVIVLNCEHHSSNAFVLERGKDIVHISLPKLSHAYAHQLGILLQSKISAHNMKFRGSRAGRVHDVKEVQRLLKVLWIEIVQPVFEKIGLLAVTPEAKERIWWFRMGYVAQLPIHAAGIYGDGSTPKGPVISDYAISSYIPSISSLINAHKAAHQQPTTFQGLLAVSQSYSSSTTLPALPMAVPECKFISDEFTHRKIPSKHISENQATQQDVLAQMDKFSWIHLACHGSQDFLSPTKSSFHLYQEQLELIDIIRKNLKSADFAFLSACQTATGTDKLESQSVHLAAGMLAAGYRSVVGTMWSINDDHALLITKEFYMYLLKDLRDGEFPDSSRAAEALQYATATLKDQSGTTDGDFMVWIPYVHFGL